MKIKKPQVNTKNTDFTPFVGVLQAMVVVSIYYSAYIIYFGTDSPVSKAMLVPAVAYASLLTIKKFMVK